MVKNKMFEIYLLPLLIKRTGHANELNIKKGIVNMFEMYLFLLLIKRTGHANELNSLKCIYYYFGPLLWSNLFE